MLAASLVVPQPAAAIDTEIWISPGFKVCWTFGRGMTYGFELSVTWAPKTWNDLEQMPLAAGIVLDLDTDFDELFMLHLGGEWVGPFIGLEIGPTLVTDELGAHFGLGFTPWISSYVIPFYTGTVIFDDSPNIHQLGAYFKLHFDTEGEFGSHHHFDDD